jgi:hypothetical protein
MEMLNLLTPLKVILNPPSRLESFPGESTTLHVSLINQGKQGAMIDVSIDPMNPSLLQWCLTSRKRVALDPQQGCEVSLQFNIPLNALPGNYPFTLVVDAPAHYPQDTPIHYQGLLEVVGREKSVERLDGPTFSLRPATSPDKPLPIQSDRPQKLFAKVNNRSNRVDCFRLDCPDLDEKWFTVQYPCTTLSELGVVSNADGLELNPGTQGEITIEFHYPMDMPAGQYSPTLQLLSDNMREKAFLDLVYLEVKPKLNLSVELETILGKVSHSPGQYRLKLTNRGNSIRELAVSASSRDERELCNYVCDPSSVNLLIGETAAISLTVHPKQKWRRPFFGLGSDLPFQINLQDLQALPLPEKLPTGLLVLKSRPWWHFLLCLLAGVSALSGLGFLIWFMFFKPSPPPILSEFKPDSASYMEGGRVRLNWTIANSDQLQQLVVLSTKDQTASKPQVYDFQKGLPTELNRFCQIGDRNLTCNNVDTGARLTGKYTFQLQLKAKSTEQSTQQDLKVAILPKPLPQVVSVGARQSQLEKGKSLNLGWTIDNFSQLGQLRVMGQIKEGKPILLKTYNFQKQIPSELAKQCQPPINETLTCSNVDLGLPAKAGDYTISLQTVSKGSQKQSPPSAPMQVQVKATPLKILAFTLNGQSSETNPSLFLKAGQVVNLNWQIQGDDVKVKLEPLGDIPANGSRTLKATTGLSQITLTAEAEQGQSVKRAFLVQVDTPKPVQSPIKPVSPIRPIRPIAPIAPINFSRNH